MGTKNWDAELAARGLVVVRRPLGTLVAEYAVAAVFAGVTIYWHAGPGYYWYFGLLFVVITLARAVRSTVKHVTGGSDLVVTRTGVGVGEWTVAWDEIEKIEANEVRYESGRSSSRVSKDGTVTITPKPSTGKPPISVKHGSSGQTRALADWLWARRNASRA